MQKAIMTRSESGAARSRADSTREKILNTAAACFLENGYRDTRMMQIAARCGLSRAAIYKHFPTKESVLLALNARVVEDTLAVTHFILNSRQPALKVIEQWMRDLLSHDQPGFIRVVMIDDAQGVLMLDQEATDDALRKVKRALTKVIRRGVREGDVAPNIHPADTAHMLQALVFSIERNNLSSRPVIEMRDSRRQDLMIATIIAGLRA
tara:strand:+ start:462 stop:1088 length:627 start_codon:yes stop_codon:yes gene_type:complete